MPAPTIVSASNSVWQVTPTAPSSICRFAISTHLCVFTCGRLRRPTRSHSACQRVEIALEPVEVDDGGRRLDHGIRATASISTSSPPGSAAPTVVRAGYGAVKNSA